MRCCTIETVSVFIYASSRELKLYGMFEILKFQCKELQLFALGWRLCHDVVATRAKMLGEVHAIFHEDHYVI